MRAGIFLCFAHHHIPSIYNTCQVRSLYLINTWRRNGWQKKWMDRWMSKPYCKIASLSTLNPIIYGLFALRIFITVLAVTQVYEQTSFKIQEIYIWSYRQGVSLYLAQRKCKKFPFFNRQTIPRVYLLVLT